jgi:thiol:disulfide interchange protein
MKRRHLISLLLAHLTACICMADGFPAGSPSFDSSYTNTLKKASKDGKPSILVFSATWCGPCQTNKAKVYPDSSVQPYHDKFVWAYLDADEALNAKAMEKYGVSGIPHIEFLDKDGKSLGNIVGACSAAEFTKKLDEIVAASKSSAAASTAASSDLKDAVLEELKAKKARAAKKAAEAAKEAVMK